ncbi:MAG: hypothetical protein EAZ99_07070 [Alphaproteobacteria bacterium]|nr:MAG: hypothetical protein EAZ99_07070 [Alphaproteobacteria bacterium]
MRDDAGWDADGRSGGLKGQGSSLSSLRFYDRTLLDAVTAAAALVALADQRVCGAEKVCLTATTRSCDALRAFDALEAATQFQRHAQTILAAPWGRGEALERVAAVAHLPHAAATVLTVARAMAHADGPAGTAEELVLAELATVLGIDA